MSDATLLLGLILRGRYDQMKETLDSRVPSDTPLYLDTEPYCSIQSNASLDTFALLLEDDRFVFDDLFICRQLYFSALPSRNLVMNHPKFAAVVYARASFVDYMYERYGKDARWKHDGMAQRYIHAERTIRYWKRRRAHALVFFLYPALHRYVNRVKKRRGTTEEPSIEGQSCLSL